MNLCFVTRDYPTSPDDPIVSGEIKNPFYLTQTLAERGHEVTVVTHGERGRSTVGNVTVSRVPDGVLLGFVASVTEGYVATREVSRLLDGGDYDLVHAHYPVLPLAVLRRTGRLGVPLVTTAHGTFVPEMRANVPPLTAYGALARANGAVQKRIERRTWCWSDRVVTAGEFQVDEMTEVYDLPPGHVEWISNGVDTDRFSPDDGRGESVRSEHGAGDDPLVLFVGRLARKKGLQYLVRALPRVRDRVPGTRVVVVGGTPSFDQYGDGLQDLVALRGLEEQVTFVSEVPERRLPAYYDAADVVAVPSINYEPLPTVVFEALASGTPVVGTDDWGIPDQVGDSETLVPEKDPERLADQVAAVLEDDEWARELGERNRERALELDWDLMTTRHVALYEEVIAMNDGTTRGEEISSGTRSTQDSR